LTAAAEKGIVHRDIKSDNIILTPKMQVKIMDFGLAKFKGAGKLTQTGSTVGTAAYMSPEQASGEEVDHRADIFSFGVVLYELLTSHLPFRGEHPSGYIYSILNEEPEPVARFNDKTTPELQRIVSKALAKDRDERYQHIADLAADLRHERRNLEYAKSSTQPKAEAVHKPKKKILKVLVPALAAALITAYLLISKFIGPDSKESDSSRTMLAVLPFENLGSPDEEYFADGITEEIITSLAKVSGLGVISRTSAIKYKKTNKSLKEIGKELGVDYILESTTRSDKSGGTSRVRINCQLIRVKDDTHLWAETYDRVFEQIFELQSDIAEKVTQALDVTLLEPERQSLSAKPTENLAAYDYFLKANEYANRGYSEKDERIAIEMYQKALELDSNFALAYASLSIAHAKSYWFFNDRTEERLNKSRLAADKALQLKPDLPEAHLALGYYYYWGHLDYERALHEFGIAQKSQPNNSDLLAAIGWVQRRQGKLDEALANIKRSFELDPRSHTTAFELGGTYIALRHYPEAERYLNLSISLAPDWSVPYGQKALLYLNWEGDAEKVRKALREGVERAGLAEFMSFPPPGRRIFFRIPGGFYLNELDGLSAEPFGSDTSGYFLFKAELSGLLGRPELKAACYDSARRILEDKVKTQPLEFQFHRELGVTYAGLGRKEEAIREGKKAVELRPVTKDAYNVGSGLLGNLARIYVMVGEYDAAIDQLEYLVSIPSWISVPSLRVDPTWAPLRNHPRFKKLVAGK